MSSVKSFPPEARQTEADRRKDTMVVIRFSIYGPTLDRRPGAIHGNNFPGLGQAPETGVRYIAF